MRNTTKWLLSCTMLLAVTFCGAWSFPHTGAPTALTINFGTEQVVLTENILQGGWYNYDDRQILTQGKSLFSRATSMTESDTFAGTFPDIVQYLDRIAPKYEVAAFNGQIDFHPHQTPRFTVRGQKVGRIIDRERLYAEIVNALKGNQYPVVKVDYRTVEPTPAAQILQNIKQRSRFSTDCTTNPDRENNIALALGKFNGLRVNPGEQVSFNQVVGRRSTATGFREAKIIVNGEYVDGVGGGVCQVSTTIFNAAVQAGLQITESHHHSLRSSYIPLGQDAMVSGAADLRFVNNTGAPIYFETSFHDHRLTVAIYGRDKGPNITYRLDTAVTKTLEPKDKWVDNLPATTIKDYQNHPDRYDRVLVKSGYMGHVVDTYLETYQGNKRLSRKLLRHNTYQAVPHRYTLHRREVAPTETTDTGTSQIQITKNTPN
ncbi:MAG: VanW family protein [Clostridia bacterium]|nr:VanW family protein [Clostridia bacterium]